LVVYKGKKTEIVLYPFFISMAEILLSLSYKSEVEKLFSSLALPGMVVAHEGMQATHCSYQPN
jgi:hypothetical protein